MDLRENDLQLLDNVLPQKLIRYTVTIVLSKNVKAQKQKNIFMLIHITAFMFFCISR